MIITDSEKQISDLCEEWRKEGFSIGFVPTMGALHDGHLSLVKAAAEASDKVIVSIFVNPSQFGAEEDLDKYPRTLEKDCTLVESVGACAVFTPLSSSVYPDGFSTTVSVSGISEGLCGAVRPGHFDGVTTVCAVLFGIVKPDIAIFGKKDAQQLAVIKRMVSDLRLPVEIVAAPILREPDGLAMSSRNKYLSVDEREQASLIRIGLTAASNLFQKGERNCSELRKMFRLTVEDASLLNVQYVDTVDPDTMVRVEKVQNSVLLAVAVFAGKTRLIDNILIKSEV